MFTDLCKARRSRKDLESWWSWKINQSFIRGLYITTQGETVTNEQAYDLYVRCHWAKKTSWEQMHSRAIDEGLGACVIEQLEYECYNGTPWMRMNVRNHLSAAAFRGILIRKGPGRYEWNPEVAAEILEWHMHH